MIRWFELRNINYFIMSEEERAEFHIKYKDFFDTVSTENVKIKLVTMNEKYELPDYLNHKYEEHKAFGCKNYRFKIYLCVESDFPERILNIAAKLRDNGFYAYELSSDNIKKCLGDRSNIKTFIQDKWDDSKIDLPSTTSLKSVIAVETEFTPLSRLENLKRIKKLTKKNKYRANADKYMKAVLNGKLSFFCVKQAVIVDACEYDIITKDMRKKNSKPKGDAVISSKRCANFNPFTVIESQDTAGFCYGANACSHKPVFFDRSDLHLPHMLICGKNGTGKWDFAANEMMQIYESTRCDNIIVIEPNDNLIYKFHERGCENYAVYINPFSKEPNSYRINPLDMCLDTSDALEFHDWKERGANTAKAVIEGIIHRSLSPYEAAAIEASYIYVFNPLIQELKSKNKICDVFLNPTLTDVIDTLESDYEESCKDLLSLIGTEGKYREYVNLFSFKTNMPDQRFISINFWDVPSEIEKACYAASLSYAYNQIVLKKSHQKHWIYLDSLCAYSKKSDAFRKLAIDLIKKSRRYQGILTFVETSYDEVFNSELATQIDSHVPFYCFMDSTHFDRISIKERFKLSDSILDFAKDAPWVAGILIIEYGDRTDVIPVKMKPNYGVISEREKSLLISLRENKHKEQT